MFADTFTLDEQTFANMTPSTKVYQIKKLPVVENHASRIISPRKISPKRKFAPLKWCSYFN